jgi:hypothetical protein
MEEILLMVLFRQYRHRSQPAWCCVFGGGNDGGGDGAGAVVALATVQCRLGEAPLGVVTPVAWAM